MNKKIISVIVLVALAFNLAGCGALRKKFTKKKKEVKKPRYEVVEEYNIKPSLELYTKHYTYWRSWHREFVEVLGENKKKDMRCIQEIIGNLQDMQKNLIPEKQEALQAHIDEMEEIENTLKREGRLSTATKSRILGAMEREVRVIKRDFTYRKMGPYIAPVFTTELIKVEEIEFEPDAEDQEETQ